VNVEKLDPNPFVSRGAVAGEIVRRRGTATSDATRDCPEADIDPNARTAYSLLR
jgi:hypothetical protein